MPIKVSHLKKSTKSLTIDWDGEKVLFAYRPGEITPALSVEMTDEDTKAPLVFTLLKVLASWDVLDDDTMQPIEITEDVLMGFPSAFLNAILKAIIQDYTVGEGKSATSGAG